MISLSRTLTLFKKDILWSMANLKLLAVMVLPVVFLVLLSRDEKTFVFSIIFVNVFIGLFSTSYLVIEEKNKGTLLALMTSPLQSIEVLLGKFLFNLLLCLGFSSLGIFLNQRFDLFMNPMVVLNIIFFAGTTCFVGFVMGLFFKNEQEMSVIAPLLMFIFSLGDILAKVSSNPSIKAFFPDYHLSQVLSPLPFKLILGHTLWNLALFFVCLLGATFYAQFYFSNSREKRFSPILLVTILSAIILGLSSGFVFAKNESVKPLQQKIEFQNSRLSAEISYSNEDLVFNKIHQNPETFLYEFKSKDHKKNRFIISVRDLDEDEKTPELRFKKVTEKENRNILSKTEETFSGLKFQQWIYIEEKQFFILKETLCQGQIFQLSIGQDLKDLDYFKEILDIFVQTQTKLKVKCLGSEF